MWGTLPAAAYPAAGVMARPQLDQGQGWTQDQFQGQPSHYMPAWAVSEPEYVQRQPSEPFRGPNVSAGIGRTTLASMTHPYTVGPSPAVEGQPTTIPPAASYHGQVPTTSPGHLQGMVVGMSHPAGTQMPSSQPIEQYLVAGHATAGPQQGTNPSEPARMAVSPHQLQQQMPQHHVPQQQPSETQDPALSMAEDDFAMFKKFKDFMTSKQK